MPPTGRVKCERFDHFLSHVTGCYDLMCNIHAYSEGQKWHYAPLRQNWHRIQNSAERLSMSWIERIKSNITPPVRQVSLKVYGPARQLRSGIVPRELEQPPRGFRLARSPSDAYVGAQPPALACWTKVPSWSWGSELEPKRCAEVPRF